MNTENYLKKWKKRVDRNLLKYLPGQDEYPPQLSKAMRHTVLAGGKRIRSILLLTIYQLCGGKEIDAIMPISCAMEFIHSYSLIHDDLPAIDDDDYRRGKPTSHRIFGEDIAILAGDALFSLAFSTICEANVDPVLKERTLKVLTRAIGYRGIIGGQVKDVEAEDEEKNPRLLRYIHSHKTATFFSAVCEIGGILADNKNTTLEYLRRGGLYMGMTFQIIDDILDIKGRREETGKDINSDENKLTYPSLYGLESSERFALRYSKLSIKQFKKINPENNVLEDIIMFLSRRIK